MVAKSSLIYALQSLDISDEVVLLLNKRVPELDLIVSMIDPLFYIRLNEKITFSALQNLLSDNLIKIDNVKSDEFVNFATLENASKEDISFCSQS